MTLIRKLKHILRESDFKKVALLFVGMLGMGLLEVVTVASIVPFMTVVADPELVQENKYLFFAYNYFSFIDTNQFLIWLGVVVILLLATSNIYSAFMSWSIIKFVNTQGCIISTRLFQRYLVQPYSFFLNRNVADLGKNILSEVGRSVSGVILPCLNVLSKLIVALALIGLLLIVNPAMALGVSLLLGGSYFLIYKLVQNVLHERGVASTNATLERFKVSNEAVFGIKDLKLRGNESEYIQTFESSAQELSDHSSVSSLISLLPRYVLEIIMFGGIVAIVIFLISEGNSGKEIIPIMSLYALAGYRLMPALQQSYLGFTQIKYNLPAMDILVKDFSELTDYASLNNQKMKKMSFSKMIDLQSICYQYKGASKPVLHGLDLKIIRNTTIGLVGPSGGGKTTLVDIILGLLSPNSGNYVVDGVKINQNNIASWQRSFGYVPQSIFLTDDSIARNIAFTVSDDQIDFDKVVRSAQLAEIDEFVRTLPEGYKTHVGDRGIRLSGGQKQRIGIARALYLNPEILVLDEATSALDGIAENVIMDAIHNLSHKKTIIIIAHRLKTVKECDVIYFMNNKKIEDSGTYEDLIKNNANFKKMAEIH